MEVVWSKSFAQAGPSRTSCPGLCADEKKEIKNQTCKIRLISLRGEQHRGVVEALSEITECQRNFSSASSLGFLRVCHLDLRKGGELQWMHFEDDDETNVPVMGVVSKPTWVT